MILNTSKFRFDNACVCVTTKAPKNLKELLKFSGRIFLLSNYF